MPKRKAIGCDDILRQLKMITALVAIRAGIDPASVVNLKHPIKHEKFARVLLPYVKALVMLRRETVDDEMKAHIDAILSPIPSSEPPASKNLASQVTPEGET